MSKPYDHAKLSVKKWGGRPEDYLAVHNFMDSSKAHVADMRHRALLHSSFGCYLAEQVFGTNIRITKYKPGGLKGVCDEDFETVSVRDVAEQHIIQDLGFIPSVQQYLDHMVLADWMGGKKKKTFTILLKGPVETEEGEDMWGEKSTYWKDLGRCKGVNKPSERYHQSDAAQVEKDAAELFEDMAKGGL